LEPEPGLPLPAQEIIVSQKAVVCSLVSLTVILLLSASAAAERTSVQEVPCEPGRERLLGSQGNISACRLATAAELLVGPAAKNGRIACSAGSHVEFHRNGYLSFCDSASVAATYTTRSRLPTRCKSGSRVAFDENGYLEYCS
jgi:hypothetical protein